MEVKPALTAEEWENGVEREDFSAYLRPLALDGTSRLAVAVHASPLGGTGLSGDLHALGALCLFGQPFGFTREMVGALRELGHPSQEQDQMDLAHQAIDRIEALLSPEDK